MNDIRRILIIGNNTRHIACSAKRAGYTVYVIDHFGDVDVRRCVDGVIVLDSHCDISDSKLNEHIKASDVDAVVLGAGFETRRVNLSEKILLGNDPVVANRVSDKEWLAKELNKLGIPHPRIYANGNIEYPAIIKPKQGMGGRLCRIIHEGDVPPDYIAQECLVGNFASVSVLSTEDDAISLAVNEQLIGVPWLGTAFPFRYCGNITPFNDEHGDEMRQIAEGIILHLRLIGSNGVDFIITKDGPVVLEVNPRFQGSLDTVELATGVNLFDAHVQAISGVLKRNVKAQCFATKMVVFATDDMIVRTSLDIDGIADIPHIGSKICARAPIATALGTGIDRKSALHAAMKKALMIRTQAPSIPSRHGQV
ncbi:MAG: ATP-grasp domain-containing protein [Methanosarcinales archaeon Met12]|nr:MAG: ATP-grasp domain-containing protein [Methanosarcinales archaeon Met12]